MGVGVSLWDVCLGTPLLHNQRWSFVLTVILAERGKAWRSGSLVSRRVGQGVGVGPSRYR